LAYTLVQSKIEVLAVGAEGEASLKGLVVGSVDRALLADVVDSVVSLNADAFVGWGVVELVAWAEGNALEEIGTVGGAYRTNDTLSIDSVVACFAITYTIIKHFITTTNLNTLPFTTIIPHGKWALGALSLDSIVSFSTNTPITNHHLVTTTQRHTPLDLETVAVASQTLYTLLVDTVKVG
jgi:hypothetical protein